MIYYLIKIRKLQEFGRIFLTCLQRKFAFKLDQYTSKTELVNLNMLIGELYQKQVLNQPIMIYCLDQLIKCLEKPTGTQASQNDYVEALVKCLAVYGELIDRQVRDTAKTNRYYDSIEKYVLNDLSVYPFRLKMFASDLVRIRKV
jgi:hypothetical protein